MWENILVGCLPTQFGLQALWVDPQQQQVVRARVEAVGDGQDLLWPGEVDESLTFQRSGAVFTLGLGGLPGRALAQVDDGGGFCHGRAIKLKVSLTSSSVWRILTMLIGPTPKSLIKTVAARAREAFQADEGDRAGSLFDSQVVTWKV
jgi:hypothetical protein